tara:strand:+ start:2599 stop:3975 length:1377 start_codon:yes stop_codon:yes gene_type:complete
MGAGKSRIVVDIADQTGSRGVLIVCPKSAVEAVWPAEFEKYNPGGWAIVPATALKGTIKQRCTALSGLIDGFVARRVRFAIIVNYEFLRSEAGLKWMKKYKWSLLVYDEAHRLKSPTGKQSKAAAQLVKVSHKRLMLSGTPLPHDPLDIFAQYRALDPAVFGLSFFRFRAKFAIMGGFNRKQVVGFTAQQELRDQMHRLMFAPDARDVQLNLPESRHERIIVELAPKARKVYKQLKSDFIADVGAGIIDAGNALTRLLRLQQLCSGLAVIDVASKNIGFIGTSGSKKDRDERALAALRGEPIRQEEVICTAKRDALADIIADTDEPIVVFGLFKQDMRIVREAAEACNAGYSELSGSCNQLAEWKAGKTRVFGVNIKSGSESIDLTRARICCYLSTGFNMGDYLQSLKRVHRPGQLRGVVYYHLHARDTVDETTWQALKARKSLVQAHLDGVGKRGRL